VSRRAILKNGTIVRFGADHDAARRAAAPACRALVHTPSTGEGRSSTSDLAVIHGFVNNRKM
jgi:hypothetical protein